MPTGYKAHPAIIKWQTGQRGAAGLLSSAVWQDKLLKDPDLRRVVICVDMVFGTDYDVRVANKTVTTTSGMTGEVYQWSGILGGDFSLDWSYSVGSANSSAKSVAIVLPNEVVDAASLIREGRMLGGIGEISLQFDGMDYDHRLVLLRGDLTDVVYGAIDQVVSCSIIDPKDTTDLLLPPYSLTTARFSGLLDSGVGKALAVVLPKFSPIPAQFISASTSAPDVVVAYGYLTVDEVWIDEVSYGAASSIYPWSELHGIDGLGDPYTGVNFTGGTGVFGGEGSESIYVGLSGGKTDGEPVPVVRYIAENHTSLGPQGVDKSLFALAESRTGYLRSRLCANASGGNSVQALNFLEGTFLSSFPMISMTWQGGYGPVVTDRFDKRVVAYLTADQYPIIGRASDVSETQKSSCFNSFSISYNYDAILDEYQGFIERNSTNSNLCNVSEQTVGLRVYDTIESLFITEEGTANIVLDWLVGHVTLPAYDVVYDISVSFALQLILGDNLAITDAEFGWVQALGTVIKIGWGLNTATMTIRIWSTVASGGGAANANSSSGGVGGQ